MSVLVMPFGAIELVQDNWIYGEMFCLVRTSLDVLLTTASILHLCCISLDRYGQRSAEESGRGLALLWWCRSPAAAVNGAAINPSRQLIVEGAP